MHLKKIIHNNRVLLIIILLAIVLRFMWLATHIERDEGKFGYTAWRWLEGDNLYKDTYDNKPPLIYVIYLFSIKIFGNTIIPLRIFNNLWFIFSLVILYKLTQLWYGKKIALLSSAFFGFFMNVPVFEAYHALIEPLVVPFIIFVIYLFWQYHKTNKKYFLLLSAFMIFFCIGFKQTNLILIFLIVITMLLCKKNIKDVAIFLILLSCLSFLLLIILIKYIPISTLLDRILFAFNGYFTYNVNFDYYLPIIIEGLPLFFGSLIGLSIILKRKKFQNILLFNWLILEFIVVILPPMFRHYFTIIIPPCSMLAGIGLHTLIKNKTKRNCYLLLFFIFILFVSLYYSVKNFYEYNFQPDLRFDGGNSYKEQIQVASFIKKNTNENDSILVWDYTETINWLSEIKAHGLYYKDFLSRINYKKFQEWIIAKNISSAATSNIDLLYIIDNYNQLKYIVFFPKYSRKRKMFDKILFSDFIDNESMTKINQVEIYPIRNLAFNDLAYYCSAIDYSEVKDECFLKLAHKANNITYCNPILNDTIRQKCLKESTNSILE